LKPFPHPEVLSTLKYRPEVDGLRALAIIPVVLFHLGLPWIGGGFVGVDVFFVISGYLISLIILREHAQGNFSFRAFWVRRARRILPALCSMVLASMVAGFIILYGFDWKALGEQALSVFGLFANVKMWKLASDYWAPGAHDMPLLHAWSLALEEQFYLVYPLLLAAILKFARKHAFKLILTITIVSFILGLIATHRNPSGAFYLLPYRAWELAAGCLLAIASQSRPAGFSGVRQAPALSALGALIIMFSCFWISEERGFPGWQALFPVIGAILIIAFAAKTHLTGRILGSAPLCYVGRISYSLYLWHWPVIVFAHIRQQQTGASVPLWGVLSLILALSIASYHWIEKPTRTSGNWALPVSILTLASISAALALVVWPVRHDFSAFKPVVWNGRLYDVTPRQKPWDQAMTNRMAGIQAPSREPIESRAYAEQGITKLYGGPQPEIVVFGDSHALMWASTIDSICREAGRSVSFFAADGTPPEIPVPPRKAATRFFTADEKFLLDSARLRLLSEGKPKLVILAGHYSGSKTGVALENLVALVTRSGSKCLIIEQPPMMPFGDRNAPAMAVEIARKSPARKDRIDLPLGEPEKWRRGRAIIDAAVTKHPSASVLEIADLYLSGPAEVCLMRDCQIRYIDDDHLSELGAMLARERLSEKIRKLLAQPPRP
jgi:peptidoglycan/LPS O-acetylase OafA/YrhL